MSTEANLSEEKGKANRSGYVRDALVRMIALADAREETRLPNERELAEQLGIGRPLVREELSKLESLHMVTRRQGSGLYIVPPARRSPEALVLAENVLPLAARSIADAMAVRVLLETETARLAALNHQQIHLDRMNIEIEALASSGCQGDAAAQADEAFHRTLAAASGNSMLSQLVELFLRLSWRRRQKYFQQAERGQKSIAEHKEVLDAVRSGDPDRASAAIRKHMQSAERFWATKPKEE